MSRQNSYSNILYRKKIKTFYYFYVIEQISQIEQYSEQIQ